MLCCDTSVCKWWLHCMPPQSYSQCEERIIYRTTDAQTAHFHHANCWFCWCLCDCKGESVMRNHVIWPAHCPVRCRIWYCKMSSKFPDSLGHSLLSSQCTSHELCFVCVVIGMVGLSMTVESDEVYFRNSWRDIKLAEWFSHCLPDECYMS